MKPIQIIAIAALALLAPIARAEDPFAYLQKHASLVGGVVVVDDQKEKLVEIRIADDFPISGKFRGAFRVSLFSVTRAGELQPPAAIPTSIEEVKAYSDAEVFAASYYVLTPNIAVECIGGVTFKTASIAGPNADPLDGTKLVGACGPRLSKDGYNVSILGGHYGPVVEEGGKVGGFMPSILVRAYIPLAFLGKNTAFVPDLAFGRDANSVLTKTLRLVISTGF